MASGTITPEDISRCRQRSAHIGYDAVSSPKQSSISDMSLSPTSSNRSNQLGRGKACLRCRRRKMRCDGARPICDQCSKASVVDCEYTDNGPTTSQLLEENVSELESRIRALQEDPAPVLLRNPHEAYQARRRSSVGQSMGTEASEPSQRIMRSFLTVALTFGFFFDIPRFLQRIQQTMLRQSQNPISSILIRTMRLVGAHFCGDDTLREENVQSLPSLLRDMASSLNDARKMEILQTELLLAYYFLYTDRKTEGYYHIAGAVSIAVACNLNQIKNAAQDRRRLGSPHHTPSPTGDDSDDDDCIRAFWTVFSLERTWSPWTSSPPAWPTTISSHEMTLQTTGLASEQATSQLLSGIKSQIPEQLLLLLRSNSAILFGEASYLADKRGTDITLFSSEASSLESSVNNFIRVASSFDLAQQDPARQRGLLLTRTLLSCSIIQLHEHICKPEDETYTMVLDASLSSVDIIKALNVADLTCVDPALGMLWGMVGRFLIVACKPLQNTPPASPIASRAGSAPNISVGIVSDALENLFSAMETLEPLCPLIGNELASLRHASQSDHFE